MFTGSLHFNLLIASIAALTTSAVYADGRSLVFHVKTPTPAREVFVASEIRDWDPADPAMKMHAINPCEFLLTMPVPLLNGLQYKFVVDGKWQTDADNTPTIDNGVGSQNSLFINHELIEDDTLELKPGVPTWDQSTLTLRDQNNTDREITVLRPPAGFQKDKWVTVYFQDGGDYLEKANAANIIANLSSEPGMPAITAVFIPAGARENEYGFSDHLGPNAEKYARFVAKSVVPAVERQYGIQDQASTRLIIGPSLGGLISLFTGLKYLNVFGNIASQSASIWAAPEKIHDLMQAASHSNVKPRVFLEWGSLEQWGITNFNQAAAQDAETLGIPLKQQTIPAVHGWLGWRNGLSEILRAFFSK